MHANRLAKNNLPNLAIITVLIYLFGRCPQGAPGATDPYLSIAIGRTNQNVVLQWFGSNLVPYQVESTSNLTTWANASLVVTGRNRVLFFTNPVAGQARAFYRLKRSAGPSAVFNAGTGVLTIIGDEFDRTIVVGRNAGGTIFVNNGAVAITGGPATVTNTVLIEVFGRDGHDRLTIEAGSEAAMPPAHLFGETGDDTLTGSGAIDDLFGGPGSDALDGGRGNDRLFGEGGDDGFGWHPGYGSDVIEGGTGQDTLGFDGGDLSENIDLSANGTRLRFVRDVSSITMDIDGVERVNYFALGGADTLVVNDLTGTGVTEINVNLAPSVLGGNAGDTPLASVGDFQPDVITLNGTPAPNTFNIAANGSAVEAAGLGVLVHVFNGGTNDVVRVVGVGGDIVNINGSAVADTMTVTAVGTNALATSTGFTIPVEVRGALTLVMNGLGGPARPEQTCSCSTAARPPRSSMRPPTGRGCDSRAT